MIDSLIRKLFKPENPIDLDFYTKVPREKYNFFERIKILYISLKSKDKNSLNFFIVFLRNVIIRILLFFFLPLSLILKFFNLKFVVVNYWQIGAYVRQLSNLYKEKKLSCDKSKYLIYAPKKLVINEQIHKAFKEDLIFVENKILCILLYIFFHSKLLRYKVLNFDEHDISSKSYYLNFLFKKKNLKINYVDKDIENFYLKSFRNEFPEVHIDNKIVSIHIRDQYFYNDQSLRNADSKTYLKAIEYLLSKGFKIFHFGNNYNNRICNKKNYYFLNLNTKEVFKKLQIYIIKNSKLFISTNSGPYSMATELDIPVLLTNLYPFHGMFSYNKNDITLPKKIIINGKKIRYKNILKDFSQSYLKNLNKSVIDNTDEEILEGVKEILFKLDNKKYKISSKDQEIKKNLLNELSPNVYGYGTISENFIKKNKEFF